MALIGLAVARTPAASRLFTASASAIPVAATVGTTVMVAAMPLLQWAWCLHEGVLGLQ